MQKKNLITLLAVGAMAGCNDDTPTTSPSSDSLVHAPAEPYQPASIDTNYGSVDSTYFFERDAAIFLLSMRTLQALKFHRFDTLADLAHPQKGIRFSRNAFIDTSDIVINKAQLSSKGFAASMMDWGRNETSDEPIRMSPIQYIDSHFYSADFLNAPNVSINKSIRAGTDLNNIKDFYPMAIFSEYHFPGFDKKYVGLDFQSLRLVFETVNNNTYLVAIVKDHWTP